jgi:3-hydroxybutyryl-CoA dehydratase
MNKRVNWVGRSATEAVEITPDLVDRFIAVSGDSSPIHVQDEAARRRGFTGRVVHGFLLGSLVSRVIGTQLPGDDGVLQQAELSFHNPCYIGDRVNIVATVSQQIESVGVLILDVEVRNGRGLLLARGTIQTGLSQPL